MNLKMSNYFLILKFLIKYLEKVSYFLGIEVLSIHKRVCLNQRKYCLELLHEFGRLDCKHIFTPLELNFVPKRECDNNNDPCLENVTEFQKLIRKLIYLAITRPELSYCV